MHLLTLMSLMALCPAVVLLLILNVPLANHTGILMPLAGFLLVLAIIVWTVVVELDEDGDRPLPLMMLMMMLLGMALVVAHILLVVVVTPVTTGPPVGLFLVAPFFGRVLPTILAPMAQLCSALQILSCLVLTSLLNIPPSWLHMI